MTARLVVAGTASGVGKTTLACALLAAFRRRGARVQPFKAGPDYIDPGFHAAAAGVESRNLDSFLLPAATLRALFARAAEGTDLAVVEGVMGLFDGRDGASEEGSTAEVAKLLAAPVVVVIDVAASARTAGAVALGCVRFDPALRIAGFVLNRVAGEAHARWATDAIETATGLPVLGALRTDDSVALPERHLGLVPAVERTPGSAFFDRLADVAERSLSLDRMRDIAGSAGPLPSSDDAVFPTEPPTTRARVAIARDEAFNFYYPDALELLEAHGAELVTFSPLRDSAPPAGVGGIYLGGGFPEVHAAALAENRPMREALARAAASGTVVYGECGGLMYLARSLTDLEDRRHEMVGLLPIDSRMRRDRLTLGYRTALALRDSPLLARGDTVRGHEFHWSELESPPPADGAAYAFADREEAREGFAGDRVLASYLHLHLATRPEMARRFVAACAGAGASP